MERKIPGGCILLSRKIIESEIWKKPPLYLKVWIYLLSKAQHKEYKLLKRGQLRISIPEIMKECSWHVGYRNVTPTKDQIFHILKWFRQPIGSNSRNPYEGATKATTHTTTKATMVTTTKATQGLLINIDNYSFYQTLKNYEGNSEGNDEGNDENFTGATIDQRQCDNINKNDNNDNNDKNDNNDNKDKIVSTHVECSSKLQPIIIKWNSLNLSKISNIKNIRLRLLNTRIKDYGIDGVLKAIENITHSDFLIGQNNNNWVITFDWFIKPNNFVKVLEGNYTNKEVANGFKTNNKPDQGKWSDYKPPKPKFEPCTKEELDQQIKDLGLI